ncbi:MAG TPA: tRNA glutamyl-Q(34) synthetase GluQRS [Micavibrio sp.]|jgi:glutamyl-Q tRNA(Asp) synthetase
MPVTTRFAPSPTGRLHLGHAWSALFGSRMAQTRGGHFLLRIEDIDMGRCRPKFISDIEQDLRWLRLEWPEPVRKQSDHFADYSAALDRLNAIHVLYPCFCTRKEIQDEIERSGAAPHGPEGAIYPGVCRGLSPEERDRKIRSGLPYALRLDMEAALSHVHYPLTWRDIYRGEQAATPEILGDVVLARKGMPASYHLCVTVDDHIQGVTLVTRGDDLFYASHLHRLLQHLLNYASPEWAHHPLLLDQDGKRFAKRNDSVTLASLRDDQGITREGVIEMIWSSLPTQGPWRHLLINA